MTQVPGDDDVAEGIKDGFVMFLSFAAFGMLPILGFSIVPDRRVGVAETASAEAVGRTTPCYAPRGLALSGDPRTWELLVGWGVELLVSEGWASVGV